MSEINVNATTAELPDTREELRKLAEEAAGVFNAFQLEGKLTEAAPYEEFITNCVNKYTAIAQKACFNELFQKDDPMLEAIIQFTFPTIRARGTRVEAKNSTKKVAQKVIEDTERNINISAMNKQRAIGHDHNWENMYKHFVFLLGKKVAAKIESTQTLADYDIKQKALDASLGETSVVSNTALENAFNNLMKAMIGEKVGDDGKSVWKFLSCDREFLMLSFTKSGRKQGQLLIMKEEPARVIIMNVLNNIVLRGGYYVDGYKKKKN